MLFFPLPPLAFFTYITMHHIELSVGRRRLYEEAVAKDNFFHNGKDV